MQFRNAIITEAFIGPHANVLTSWIRLDYGNGQVQNFGGFPLAEGRGEVFIRGVLDAAGVASWDKLVGVAVRVEQDEKQVHRIGHIVRDQWFFPADAMAALMSRRLVESRAPDLMKLLGKTRGMIADEWGDAHPLVLEIDQALTGEGAPANAA